MSWSGLAAIGDRSVHRATIPGGVAGHGVTGSERLAVPVRFVSTSTGASGCRDYRKIKCGNALPPSQR